MVKFILSKICVNRKKKNSKKLNNINSNQNKFHLLSSVFGGLGLAQYAPNFKSFGCLDLVGDETVSPNECLKASLRYERKKLI